jgi:uncharacterized protein
MVTLLILAIVLVAAFVQTLAGFGFALLVTPLVALLVGLQTAAPLVAMVALGVNTINFVRHRDRVDRSELARLVASSAVGVPLGILLLRRGNEAAILWVLGVVLIGFALYSILRPRLARALGPRWVYPSGLIAGCLAAAYNAPGPPLLVYGALRQWPKEEFRGVLHGLFCLNGAMVVAAHALVGNVTGQILEQFAWTVPVFVAGIWLGTRVDAGLDRERFRMLVTVLILALGVSLLVNAGQR